MNWQFFLEVLVGGLLAGVMYSLVALGFVLIYKASGVFNFAQGAMVFFAALTFVSLVERGFAVWVAFLITFAAMVVFGIATERVVLRPLVNQPPITLFMATIGLTFVLEGLSQLLWGSQPHGLELGIEDMPLEWLSQNTGINVSQFDLFAALVAGILVSGLALFFQKTRIGRALRAVADDHQAALAVGIPLQQIWAIVWAVAGFVALVAGPAVGRAQRRAVFAHLHRAQGAAGADPRRLRVGGGRDRRRAHHRRLGKTGGDLHPGVLECAADRSDWASASISPAWRSGFRTRWRWLSC